ncbi:MAG: DNA polymerase III subunit gamma/tau [Bacteroidota bacterium]|nr:DNA polymerase III subunit gamma/tau [Bacteroidota bacterium]MDP4232891.1 DNA polymerase III subunit gamma/tau [Bacteroidota bacterium]MDP4241935.1 DNA polymerase III subunit gamma/tau [Bacteroidota bacterium]MDP4286838.1 DNA polymerase III subunit gamma/tau [Bacteroidota bacterium]
MSEIFQVTARKWRPMRFEDVVGQEHVTRTLKNAIREGRLAHAFLFTGQRGCGKTTVARLLAKAINCPNAAANGYEPCNTCDNCLSITDGRSMDVAEIDGASNNGVDDVRGLRENVKYPPLQGAYKVIIIDEVHMLSSAAFNALLKTLEEPPKYLIFIFATTEVQKVLPTILSRTQRYDFRRIQIEEITGLLRKIALADGITIDDDALLMIAKKADGSARDAESIFDQAVAFCGMTVQTEHLRDALALIDLDFYFEVTTAIASREAKRAFELAADVISRGYDIEEFLGGLLEHFRNILTVSITKETKLLEVSRSHAERYLTLPKDFSEGDIVRLVRLAQQALEKLRVAQQPRIVLEVAMVEMMMLERAIEIAQLLDEVRALRSAGNVPSPTMAQPAPIPEKKSNGHVTHEAHGTHGTHVTHATNEPHRSRMSQKSQATPTASDTQFPLPDEIANRWSTFGDFLKTKSRTLHSILPDLELCGIRRSTIYIGTSGRIERDMLATMKDEMTLALREFFGAPLIFEAGPKSEMQAKAGTPILQQSPATTTTEATKPDGARTEMEIALMERLGAQEV